jgi:hypothetical protein
MNSTVEGGILPAAISVKLHITARDDVGCFSQSYATVTRQVTPSPMVDVMTTQANAFCSNDGAVLVEFDVASSVQLSAASLAATVLDAAGTAELSDPTCTLLPIDAGKRPREALCLC